LLESSAPSYEVLDAPVRGGAIGTVFILAARTLWWAAAVVVGVPVMGWLAILAGRRSRPRA
jgi:hypothetical protein